MNAAFDDVESALRARLQLFLDAIDRADATALASMWCDDATMYFPFGNSAELHRGRDAIMARFARMFDDLREKIPAGPPYVRFRVLAFEFHVLDERHALVYTTLGFAKQRGRRTVVMRRERSGWRLYHVHASNFDERPSAGA